MQKKPSLSFWQIWNMSFGFLGIQFGWGLQLANMSPIYKYLGASESELPYLWLAGPMTGLLVQPIIGAMSDRTWTKLGRRRPFFLVGAIVASIALILMPNSSTLWFAAGLLWILDSSINITMEPFRAFVADNLPEEQRTLGFVMQSFFIGIGQTLANALPFSFDGVRRGRNYEERHSLFNLDRFYRRRHIFSRGGSLDGFHLTRISAGRYGCVSGETERRQCGRLNYH